MLELDAWKRSRSLAARCARTPLAADHRGPCPACEGLPVAAGHFRLGQELGRGGTGVVYAGERLGDGVAVAVKVISLEAARDWKAHDLFQRGTLALLHLDHPNVPRALAFEQDGRGRLYQVRERLDGGTLQERVETRRGLAPHQLRPFVASLLRTLHYLHMRSPPLIHRDIKPANVMFRTAASWDPVLVDFEAISIGASLTGTTIIVSPGYTAPEQLAGHAVPASDLYSVGATLLYALTGREPSTLPQRGGKHDLAPLLAHVEPRVARVVARLLEPSLTERYASAAQALSDLERPEAAIAPAAPGGGLARWRGWALFGFLALLGIANFTYWAAGYEVQQRADAFQRELGARSRDFEHVGPQAVHQTVEALAFKHRLVLSELTSRVHRIQGTTIVTIQDELKVLGVYQAGEHAVVDESLNGVLYVTLDFTVSGDTWLWTRELALQHTFKAGRR